MATTTQTNVSTTIKATSTAPPTGRLFSKGTDVTYGDFRDDLLRDGYAVVKGAIPQQRALAYVDNMYDWLENL